MRKLLFSLILIALIFPADSFGQRKNKTKTVVTPGSNIQEKINLRLENSKVFNKSFTGFALYDPVQNEMLYEYNSDKYYTPASNTKILTLLTSLQILGDSIPALMYQKQGDLLLIWGTGDPSFLNPHLSQNESVFKFLKNRPEKLLYCPANFRDSRYGSGWMWSDYPYSYQAEKSPFPIYGNVAHFQRDGKGNGLEIKPSFLENYFTYDSTLHQSDLIGRKEFDNFFTYNKRVAQGDEFDWHAPFRATPSFIAEILSDTLKKKVSVINQDIMPPLGVDILYSVPADSLYQRMMQESDNFIAEQLLLLCSEWKFGNMNTEQIIDYSIDSIMSDLPDEPKWVDGSGLSRYNLFTPRSVVAILEKLYRQVPRQRLLNIFPAGGISGTIENNYQNGSSPYVFAKTGTLRNNHCLSGYLLTRQGKLLIFSFMHNNYTIRTSAIKNEMERVLKEIYAKN